MTAPAAAAPPLPDADLRRVPHRAPEARARAHRARARRRRSVIDLRGRAHGRGAYLCADGSCWALALKKQAIERALDVHRCRPTCAQLAAGDPHCRGRCPWLVVEAARATSAARASRSDDRRRSAQTAVQTLDPAHAGRGRDPQLDHGQGARRAARGQPRGRHPRADQERHLRQHQPAHRPRHGQPRDRASSASRSPRRGPPSRPRPNGEAPDAAGHQGGPLRGGRSASLLVSRGRRS